MAIGLSGAGHLGVAKEVTKGTWVTPAKFIPIMEESLEKVRTTQYRKGIRGLAEPWGAAKGPHHIEGQVKVECTPDFAWFLYGMRGSVNKSAGPPYTYTFTPGAQAASVTGTTMSISVKRGDNGFGYKGCMFVGAEFSVEDGIIVCTLDVIGEDENAYTPGATSYGSQVTTVYDYDAATLEIPDTTARTDIDTVSISISEGSEARNNITGNLGATYIVHGEREVMASVEADYDANTDKTIYDNLTASSLTLDGTVGSTAQLEVKVDEWYYEKWSAQLSGLGDLVRASFSGKGVYKSASSR